MIDDKLNAGWFLIVCGLLTAGLSLAMPEPGRASDAFPFGEELLLDTPPMRPGKRMPGIIVERGGNAVIDLWCKSVPARVELTETAIRIDAAPLPEELPAMQSTAQCTPERILADAALLAALTQVTAWRPQKTTVILEGPHTMRFKPATN